MQDAFASVPGSEVALEVLYSLALKLKVEYDQFYAGTYGPFPSQ